tara:strand:- start:247 stop:552 length:306 start_codon:yes stop_codon:yes gene_type:complete
METTYNNGQTILVDDRTEQQFETHKILITATDKFMSGWGNGKGGSKCAWACKNSVQAYQIMVWVESRSEMKYVNINYTGKWRPKNASHVHIYVVNDDHPAL